MVDDTNLAQGCKGAKVVALQEALAKLDYFLGAKDGDLGNLTRDAVLAFQADNGLPTTGKVDNDTWKELSDASPRPLARTRTKITAAELAQKGSETIRQADRTKFLGWVSGLFGLLGVGASTVTPAATSTAGDQGSMLSVQPAIDGLRQYLDTATTTGGGGGAAMTEARDHLNQIQQALTANASSPLSGDSLLQLIDAVGVVIPGASEGVIFIVVGFIAHFFGQRIVRSRVEDHQDAANLAR
ncbi:peptidoglycan-binding domain-containing protein [Bauldia sp.]|uniref:peptidoglycan-binding domain-containing protein n=1 Tax=Bauldia sp. TaxID=2575872 RepID=UPI003BAB8126